MYNQTEAILSQYEVQINQTAKGRGVIYCETNQGELSLCGYRGSKERGEALSCFLQALRKEGLPVEQIVLSKTGEAVCEEELSGERFILKRCVKGAELGTGRYGELLEAVTSLARFHVASDRICQKWEASEEEKQYLSLLKQGGVNVLELRMRHHKELQKVFNFTRSRKKRGEFEQLYMQSVGEMLETSKKSVELLGQFMGKGKSPRGILCHGDCNHHNFLRNGNGWQLVNFENVSFNWAVWDLVNFIRKLLEKNQYDEELGLMLLHNYNRVRPLAEEEWWLIYALFLFPEKYWKIANHYMNGNKAWIPARDIEKLKKVIELEPLRKKFLEKLFSNLPK